LPKLTPVIISLLRTAVLNLLGCSTAERPVLSDGNYRVVERAIDGDTSVIDYGERVRLIGVDTPETEQPRKPLNISAKRLLHSHGAW
jgi:micrococcal nuclease